MNWGEDPGLGGVCGGLLGPLPASQGLPMPFWLVNLPLEWKAVPYWPMCDRIASSGFEKQENREAAARPVRKSWLRPQAPGARASREQGDKGPEMVGLPRQAYVHRL